MRLERGESGQFAVSSGDDRELPPPLLALHAGEARQRSAPDAEPEVNPLLPREPVAVGATWSVDLERMAEEFAADVDLTASQGSGALKGVTERDGVRYAQVTFEVRLALTTFQGLPCPEPMQLALTGKIELALEPAPPFGSTELTMTIKGAAVTPDSATRVEVDIASRNVSSMRKAD